MPNRILKESICTSDTIDRLTEFQEIFFYRLLVNCDDYGRMDARPKILSSKLFPLRPVATASVENALDALIGADLITPYSVGGKPYLQVTSWNKHQQVRAKRSKYPSPDDDELKPIAEMCKQMISNDSICPRNPIQSESESISESESESEPLITDAAAHEIRLEQDRILDAASDAGFQMSNTVRAQLISLYAEHGMDKMLNAINECATHSAVSIAYLTAVLNGSGKHRRPRVPAQDFPQRDYSDVQSEMMNKLEKEIAAMREVT